MTRNVYNKNIRRTIFGSLGRYIAIMAIIALGVGFFAGVKNTKGSMMETLDKYVQDQNMYDYRLISTYGFTEDDEKALQKVDAVAEAEGSVTADFFSQDRDGNSIILKAHSMTADINLPKLEKGIWKRVLFVPTGALMSPVSFNEGQSVPGIAHGIVLEHC